MTQEQYSWSFTDDKTRDIRAFEIRKKSENKPFTVLIFNHSIVGDKQLFSDLFYVKAWDERRGKDGLVSDDVRFCIWLWRELNLHEENGGFEPKHIIHDLYRQPTIYREFMNAVLARKFGTGEIEQGDLKWHTPSLLN